MSPREFEPVSTSTVAYRNLFSSLLISLASLCLSLLLSLSLSRSLPFSISLSLFLSLRFSYIFPRPDYRRRFSSDNYRAHGPGRFSPRNYLVAQGLPSVSLGEHTPN